MLPEKMRQGREKGGKEMMEGLEILICLMSVFAALTVAGWITSKVMDLIFRKEDER